MTSTNEIESFVLKFKNLCHAGLKATLTLEAENGEAFVSLKAGIGCLHPPFPPPHSPGYPSQPRSPSYYRRQERRKATTAAAKQSSVAEETQTNEIKENVANKELSEEDKNSENAKETKPEVGKMEKLAEKADLSFGCQVCDFQSKWENGLKLHIARKHNKNGMEKFDELKNAENSEIDQKYENTNHYWKTAWLGTIYRTFIDANDIIKSSDILEEQKKIELTKVLEARKKAFGRSCTNFPPWCRERM